MRYARVVITARQPRPVESKGFPTLNGVLAGIEDVSIDVISPSGERMTLGGCISASWQAVPGEPLTATIRLHPDVIETEAWAALEVEP